MFKRLLALLGERVGKSSRAVLAAVAGLDLLGATPCQAIEDVAFFWRGRWRLSQSIGTGQRMMLLLAYGGLHSNGNKLGHQRPQRSAGNARKDDDGSPPVKQRQYRCMDGVDPESLGYVNTRMAAYPAGENGCFVVTYHFVSDARLGVGARSG